MPIIASGIAQSMAGAPISERAAPRAVDKPATKKKGRAQDEIIVDARAVESDEALRNLKSNDQEESTEDHQEHPAYTRKGKLSSKAGPRLDIAG